MSARSPLEAVPARSKDKVNCCGVALLTRMLETPSRVMDADTRERSKPVELTVNVGEVPALTFLGETLMGA